MSSTIPSWIEHAIGDLHDTLLAKNADYKIDGEFSNFEHAADIVTDITGTAIGVDDAIALQVGIKLGRLKGLPINPNNEARLDTLKDLAGYAIILYAHALSLADDEGD